MKWFSIFAKAPAIQEPTKGASREYPERKPEAEVAQAESWWQPFWTLSSLFIALGLIAGLAVQFVQWVDRPIAKVTVLGATQHLDRQALAEQTAAGISATLLQLDLAQVQENLMQKPWVRHVAISRKWPNTLQIHVEEEVPVARWGEDGLLNHQGNIFWPELKEQYSGLPKLSGPRADTERVMSQFHDLNQMFRAEGVGIVSLNLEDRGAWTLVLDNNIKVVVGRENVNERLRRFLELYRLRLAQRAEEIEQIDIRYTHGVAVKWREKNDEESTG